MGRIIRTYFFSFFLLLLASLPAYSQKYKGTNLKVSGEDSPIKKSLTQEIFEFKNINKTGYYQDKKDYRKIKKYDREQRWDKLYPLLGNYVRKFGIQNFYKDTYMLWRLAKLTEMFGDPEEAKALYRLVLKHHRNNVDIRKVELYYDSLMKNDIDLFVPLEYYYELVEFRKEIDTLRPPRGVLLNMGANVNSKASDYGPTLSIQNNLLLITSKRNEKRGVLSVTANEDIFVSKDVGGIWTEAKDLDVINSRFNEGSPCLSRDGKTLYFARCGSPDGYGNCDIFVSYLQEDSTWSKPQNLGFNINSKGWDSHPSLSHTEDTLYFASDRIGGFGLSDIYFSYKDKGGNWTRAQNLGPVVNTRGNDVSPFYHPVYKVLYFSSNSQTFNFGEFDIYKTYQQADGWSNPKNIGPLVNGKGSEFYFTIDSESKNLYYARSEKKNMENLDLFSFPLPMEAQPLATTSVKGSLIDSVTNKPYTGIVSIIDLDNGIEVAPKFLNPDGTFEFSLINKNNYLLVIQGDNFFRIEEMFYLDGDVEMHRSADPLSTKMKFESIEFDNGKADMKSEMFNDLNKVVDFLLDNPDFKLKISGHTDSDGSEELNLKLSQDRADAIKEYITYFGGIDEYRVTATGFGSSKPIVEEKTAEDKKLNRRVEFHIYRPGKEELEKDREYRRKKMEEEEADW